jgi:cellulose synthase/poly-beta-1,6-N-acetylglucosamine synthase-like glycosyltransferase
VAARRRVAPIHVRELPPGWLGKLHAMQRGLERATGDWVLFSDADVHVQPGTLRRVVAYAEAQKLDHVAAVPSVWRGGTLLDTATAFFLRTALLSG